MGSYKYFNICKIFSSFIFKIISSTFWKEKLFITKNYLRIVFRYFFRQIRFILLMLVPLFIFLLLLFPTFFNRYPIFFDTPVFLPHIYTLEGEVKNQKKNNLVGVSIAIGGFNTETNEKGKFKLTFLAKESKDIPIVFSINGNSTIREISYTYSKKINQTFYLNQ